jgi:hypothetical protein
MKILLSPAKKLDFSEENFFLVNTNISFSTKSIEIMNHLSSYSALELSDLMKVSANIAILNKERNENWIFPFPQSKSKQALLFFKGEVFQNMRINEFDKEDFEYANNKLRILSGLYGYLSPSDVIMPYRLEMGTKIKVGESKNLYEFWKNTLTNSLVKEISKDDFLLNLASEEYFKVIDKSKITIPIITPVFKDIKNGKSRVVSFFAKRARGEMCNFIIKNKINSIEEIKQFNRNKYKFAEVESTANNLVFIR